jgi:hypothetical protein
MLHISVAEMLVNNLSTPHADMPVEVLEKPGLFARFGKMIAFVNEAPPVPTAVGVPVVHP